MEPELLLPPRINEETQALWGWVAFWRLPRGRAGFKTRQPGFQTCALNCHNIQPPGARKPSGTTFMRKFYLISALPQLALYLHDTLMPFLELPHILPYNQVFRWPGSKSLQTVAFFPRSMLCITHQSGLGFYLFDWDEADVSSCQAEGFFISSSPQVEDITGRFFAGLFPTLWSVIGIQKNNQR